MTLEQLAFMLSQHAGHAGDFSLESDDIRPIHVIRGSQ